MTPGTPPSADPVPGATGDWARPAIAFVLLDRTDPTPGEVSDLLVEVLGGQVPVLPADEDSPATSVELGDTVVFAQAAAMPVPGGDARTHAADLPMWGGRESVVDTHRSHVIVTSVRVGTGDDPAPDPLDPLTDALRRELAVAHVAAALTALDGAVAVNIASAATTMPAETYRSMVAGNPIPVPALVGVRAGWQSEGMVCVYTTGMGRFGRHDLERRGLAELPGQAYGQMCDLVAYALGSGTVYSPGQTLEITDGVRLAVSEAESPLTGERVLELSVAS